MSPIPTSAASTPWHVSERLAGEYATHHLAASMAASVEAHLLACAACRGVVGDQVPAAAVERVWRATTDALDVPRVSMFERMATIAGVPATMARLIGTTPAVRAAWLLSLTVVSVATALLARTDVGASALVLIAPLVPVAGVGVSYALTSAGDSLEDATPFGRHRLLLLRTATVVATSVLVLGVSSVLVADLGIAAAAWLLPALALSTITLALSATVGVVRAALRTGVGWLVVAEAYILITPAALHPSPTSLGALGLPLQLAALTCLLLASGVAVHRRDLLDLPLR